MLIVFLHELQQHLMGRQDKREYMICAIYDTETTNIGEGINTRAICILYIFNDIRLKDLSKYQVDIDDDVKFYRTVDEALQFIDELIEFGLGTNVIPVICAYNLMFDMQTLMFALNSKYEMCANAQSGTNVYTLELKIEDKTVL